MLQDLLYKIYAKVSEREIPFMKISKRLYFSKKDLLGYIEGGRKRTRSELQNIQQLKGGKKS